MIDLDGLLEANKLLMSDLDTRAAAVSERDAKARRMLELCENERRQIEIERNALLAVEKMYRRKFVPDPEGYPQPSLQDAQRAMGPLAGNAMPRAAKRARVGPQRYRMLVYLRSHPDEWHSIVGIAQATNLGVKRVRDQMKSDTREGIVFDRDEFYQLTPDGLAHLTRFEAYKREKGEPLPSLDGPVPEEDEYDEDIQAFDQELGEAVE